MCRIQEFGRGRAVILMALCHLVKGEARAIYEVGAAAAESEHDLIHHHVLHHT